jgi:hypothetical protein
MAVATATLIVAGVGLAGQAIASKVAADKAAEAEGMYNQQAKDFKAELDATKANRIDIKNPYENVTNAFENLTNPYAGMTNQYANLGVATQAAEFQAEQADLALANSLDAMMKTGMGSGGATALAQAALQSKKGIAADIQQQEAANQKMAAKGAMDVAQMKAEGQLRTDQAKAQGDAQAQQLRGAGEQFRQQLEEQRSMSDMGYAAGMMQNAQQNAAMADMAQTQAIVDLGSAFGQTAMGIGGAMESNQPGYTGNN